MIKTILRVQTLIFIALLLPFAAAGASDEWIYTVQPGDNLWNLSRKHLKSLSYWKPLGELNHIADPHRIPPGSTLRFPIDWLRTGPSVAEVIGVNGSARVLRSDGAAPSEATMGVILWRDDRIQTAPESNATLRFADGSTVLLQAGTELRIGELMRYGTTGMAETELHLDTGRTHNSVTPDTGPSSRFQISTPSALAAVRGTEYRLSADPGGLSRTEVLAGMVDIDSSGTRNRLNKGFGSVSYKDEEPLPPTRLLPPPDLGSLPLSVTRVPFPLQFITVDKASQYRLQIARDHRFISLVHDAVSPGPILWGPDIPDGDYVLRINAIDEHGLEGFYSTHAFTMDAHPIPPMPVSPPADAMIPGGIPSFSWSEPGPGLRYHFQLANNTNFSQPMMDSNAITEPTLAVTTPLPTGLYHWRVASVGSDGKRGPFNDPQSFRSLPPNPDLDAATLDQTSKVYRWPATGEGLHYRLQIAKDAGFAKPLLDRELDTPQFRLEELTPGTYQIRVAVVTKEGDTGPFTPPQSVTLAEPPPSILTVIGSALFLLALAAL